MDATTMGQAQAFWARQAFGDLAALLRPVVAADGDDDLAAHLYAAACYHTNQPAEAHTHWARLAHKHPTNSEYASNQAAALIALKDYPAARAVLLDLSEREPNNAAVWTNLAKVYMDEKDLEAARSAYERVCVLTPDVAAAHFHLACACDSLRDYSAAEVSYRRALALNPCATDALGNYLMVRHYGSDLDVRAIHAASVELGARLEAATPVCRHDGHDSHSERRLRIGLLSPDIIHHPVGMFAADVLADALAQHHFDVTVYSNSTRFDAYSERVKQPAKAWRVIAGQSDEQVAAHIQADGIDILMDLSGYTRLHRVGVLARQPAPVQVSWLGYFASLGLSRVHYVIADPICVPQNEQDLFCEQVLTLPHSRLMLFEPEGVAVAQADALLRAQQRVSAEAAPVVFSCHQEAAKINHRVLALWAQILAQCPNSSLRLQTSAWSHSSEVERMRQRMQAAGIAPERVQWHGSMNYGAYLRAHGEVDVLLDTFPYPGGTTTVEALWMGVPTLTLATPGMLGRQGEGLLTQVALREWIAHSEAEYVARAVAFAHDWADAAARQSALQWRQEIPQRVRAAPAANAQQMAEDVANRLRQAWAEYVGQASDPL